MRKILLLVCLPFFLPASGCLFADIVTLQDGGRISGVVETGNTQELHVKVEDRSQTIDIHQVQTIQFTDSAPASPAAPAAADSAPPQPNSLILKDGTRVAGRWWSIDAAGVHFLVNNQLQSYPRAGVAGVTFGSATLPAAQPHSTPPPATSAQAPPKPAQPASNPVQPPVKPAQPAAAPKAPQSPAAAPPQPSAPAVRTPASRSPRRLSQPDEIGTVYSWNGKVLTPLEHARAVERKSGSDQYWEIPAPQSRLRLTEDSVLVFSVYLQQGVDPASYSLFPLVTVNGGRRTRSQSGRHGALVTWPVDIVKQNDASIVTYVLTVKDLPAGEYSFSPSNSNDSYCFGVDPAPPGR